MEVSVIFFSHRTAPTRSSVCLEMDCLWVFVLAFQQKSGKGLTPGWPIITVFFFTYQFPKYFNHLEMHTELALNWFVCRVLGMMWRVRVLESDPDSKKWFEANTCPSLAWSSGCICSEDLWILKLPDKKEVSATGKFTVRATGLLAEYGRALQPATTNNQPNGKEVCEGRRGVKSSDCITHFLPHR